MRTHLTIRSMLAPAMGLSLLAAAPLPAQQPGVGQRVDKLEKEMRAVQRKVFPGGAYLEPEISAPPVQTTPGGNPASAPIADLTARVSSLEQELQRMTGQIEQTAFRQRELEAELARVKGDASSRLDALERGGSFGSAAPASPPATAGDVAASGNTAPAPVRGTPRNPPPAAEPAPVEAAPAEAPPATADPGEEAYLVGYRLWVAKDYTGAETALKAMAAQYPRHKRTSYAQNLLGRTYLDSGKPAAAAVAFHANYTKNPRGERAPDSLYYLGQALMKLPTPQPAKACEAYEALTREYGEKISASLKDQVAKARVAAKCAA